MRIKLKKNRRWSRRSVELWSPILLVRRVRQAHEGVHLSFTGLRFRSFGVILTLIIRFRLVPCAGRRTVLIVFVIVFLEESHLTDLRRRGL